MNHEDTVYCGVDVSKDPLDVLFKGHSARFENTVKGVRAMTTHIGRVHYVLESTGGYERMADDGYRIGGEYHQSITDPALCA